MKRKGTTSPTGAALLVAVIAAMIVLYMLFLPPDERARILEEDLNGDSGTHDKVSELHGKILLKEDPGRLDLIKTKTFEHTISPFNLISTTKGTIIKEVDSVHVEKTSFNEKGQSFDFVVNDVENTDNLLLSFENTDHSGRLIIDLNGKIISDKNIEEQNPPPIKLGKENIRESNTLTFSSSSPGILFFKTNRYNLENVKIFADITDNSGLENTQSFFVTNVEKANADKAIVSFMTNCLDDTSSSLNVLLNRQTIYDGVPQCDLPIKIEVSPTKIIEGENQIKFASQKASFAMHQVEVETRLKEEVYPTYYFEVDDEIFDLIEDDELDINMTIIFVTDKNFEDVEVEINGRKFSIDNKERIHSEVIDPYIRKGNNAITLRPLDGTVDIVELKIQVIDEEENNNKDDYDHRTTYYR